MSHSLLKLYEIVKKLRHPEKGCPWDRTQTHSSLCSHLIEECYEFIAAVEQKDVSNMEEELGDVLLQILLHAVIAEEKGLFDLNSVMEKLSAKLTRRHPHVFAGQSAATPEEALAIWNKEKTKERPVSSSAIGDSTLHAPSLTATQKIGNKAAKIGFDWSHLDQVMYKVEEEWQELKEEIAPQKTIPNARIKEELGDLLFATVQLARHLQLDAEDTLKEANKKFLKRFRRMEKLIKSQGFSLAQMDQKEMDVFWDQSKEELHREHS